MSRPLAAGHVLLASLWLAVLSPFAGWTAEEPAAPASLEPAAGPVSTLDRLRSIAAEIGEWLNLTSGPSSAAPHAPELKVGLVWPADDSAGKLAQGVQLAIEEINTGGGVLGKRFGLVRIDEPQDRSAEAGSMIGREVTGIPGIVAVLGHTYAHAAMMASVAYEQAEILYLNLVITDRLITKGGFDHVFSLIGNNDRLGEQLATMAEGLGHRRVAVLTSREEWAFQVAYGFDQQASVLGIEIPVRRSFYPDSASYLDLIAELGAAEFDLILVIARQAPFELVARQSHQMGIDKPIMAGSMLDPSKIKDDLNSGSDPLIIPILFDAESTRPEVTSFREAFRARFNTSADSVAAQGYDAMHLMADSMRATGSTAPLSTATLLRHTVAWTGVTGRHSFDRLGRIYSKPFRFAILDKGRLEFLGDGS